MDKHAVGCGAPSFSVVFVGYVALFCFCISLVVAMCDLFYR